MTRHAAVIAALALVVALSVLSSHAETKPPAARVPVLVELFTSEGCSSCPPADRVLATLIQQPVAGVEVVALGEHVDYWNRLGWSDPFSTAAFSERQRDYAQTLGGGLYTPQLVVDGGRALVGSDLADAERAIGRAAREPKETVAARVIELGPGQVMLDVRATARAPQGRPVRAEVLLAVTEDHLASHVTAGENQGRQLSHVAVVRRLIGLGPIGPSGALEVRYPLALDARWKRENVRLVTFVQDPGTRRILGAASIALQ
jgi:hypothetical protein